MSKGFFSKFFPIIAGGVLCIFLLSGVFYARGLYRGFFKLSSSQIVDLLPGPRFLCEKLSDCELLPGDILIRRYITSKTRFFDEFADPYFTHSAFYLGDGQIVEAIGTEKDRSEEIRILPLAESGWMDSGVESFVVIRPKYPDQKLDLVKANLVVIANDPDYGFGLPAFGSKQATCADLILGQLAREKVIDGSNFPEIITPDYLFRMAANNPDFFGIIGYGFLR